MMLSSKNKVWFSTLILLLFFVFNILLSYKTFVNTKAENEEIFLHIGISSLFYFLSIITFIQYLLFKEPTYLYYVLYLLINHCYFTIIFSSGPEAAGYPTAFFKIIRYFLALPLLVLSYSIYIYFVLAFLSLSTKDIILYKWIKVILKIYLSLLFLIIVSYLFFPADTTGEIIRTLLQVCCIPLGIISIVLVYIRVKNIIAHILIIGTLFFFIGSVLGFLFSLGILNYPANVFPFNQWIFYTALGVVMEIIMFFSSFAYRNKILADEEKLAQQKLQVIRDDIARDLHDDIGASLSNINILNELAKRSAGNTIKLNEYLERAGDDIQHVSEGLNDIVWNINSKYDNLENLFFRMKRYAADMMDGKNINYKVGFPEKPDEIKLEMYKRRDLYFIFKEIINNLAKYSKAANAVIELGISASKLQLTIKDDGVGFNFDTVKKGNGLHNMQQRAINLKGVLKITTAPQQGTVIDLIIPV